MQMIVDAAFGIRSHFKIRTEPLYLLELASGKESKLGLLGRRQIGVARKQGDHKPVGRNWIFNHVSNTSSLPSPLTATRNVMNSMGTAGATCTSQMHNPPSMFSGGFVS